MLSIKVMGRASADVEFIFLAFNLRRLFNTIGTENLKKWHKDYILCAFQHFRSISLSENTIIPDKMLHNFNILQGA